MSTILGRVAVVGTGGEATAPSLVLSVFRVPQFSAEEKPLVQILINCGECTCRHTPNAPGKIAPSCGLLRRKAELIVDPASVRRTMAEAGCKLTRATHLLVTRLNPDVMCGIPSLLFHLR